MGYNTRSWRPPCRSSCWRNWCRVGEAHTRHVEISPEVLGEEATAAYAVTNAGVQGKTCRKRLRICDVGNPFMSAEHLYVALSRATEEGNVRVQ